MIQIRRAADRGHFDHGWLDTCHTFSFGDYHDPRFMGFRVLRVLNEDVIAPGAGFGRHGHRDMEILTLVLSGALRHEDSLGHGSVIAPGQVQRMSAGRGILHAEANPSDTEPVHLLQIWILPWRKGLEPGYEQAALPAAGPDGWGLVATPPGGGGAVTLQQDVTVAVAELESGQVVSHELAAGRHAWIQVTRGALALGSRVLRQGDGVAVDDEPGVELRAEEEAAQVLLFDLP